MSTRVITRRFTDHPPIDRFDSSWIIPTMTAATLKDEDFTPFETSALFQAAALALPRAGGLARRMTIEQFARSHAVQEEEAFEWKSPRVARWFTKKIPRKKFPVVVIAPPIGPIPTLCRLLKAPLLPVNYCFPILKRETIDPEETKQNFESAQKCAGRFLATDNAVNVVCEHDPIHNRHRVRHTNLLRFRFTEVPKEYIDTLAQILAPDGTILLIEVRTGWRQYRGLPGFNFQIGAPGGISDDEYLRGSKRISAFLEKYMKAEKAFYRITAPHEVVSESLSGVLPSFRDSVYSLASYLQRPVAHVMCEDHFALSRTASALFLRAARKEGKRPAHILLHTGAFVHPQACFKSAMFPVWVPDASFQSHKFAATILDAYPFAVANMFFGFEPSLSDSPDMLDMKKWHMFKRENAGAMHPGWSPRSYPLHFKAYGAYWKTLSAWSKKHEDSIDMWLKVDETLQALERIGIRTNVVNPGE